MIPIQSEFRVFFSWESDIEKAHSSLRRLLDAAAVKIENELTVKVIIDEATRDAAGSPDIVQCVTKKIEDCDVFVADISPVCPIPQPGKEPNEYKLCPNPNVMFELGYAVSRKGWNRVILLSTDENGKSKNMPFDINHNRTDVVPIDKNKDLKPHLFLPIQEIINSQKNDYPLLFDTARLYQNIQSEKFIEAVYIGDYDFKQQLRAYVDPYIFFNKLSDEVNRFSFDVVNEKFECEGKPKFTLKLPDLRYEPDQSFEDFLNLCNQFVLLLTEVHSKLSEDGNTGYINALKIRHKIDIAKYLPARICLIPGEAGQGKTNLVCNLVKNILLKRNVPYIYLNGYELNPLDISSSFVQKGFENMFVSMDEAMSMAGKLCYRIHKPLIVIVDGLNEIPYDHHISENLNLFVSKLLKYDFVKVLMTCRQSYYDSYFKDKLTFKDEMIVSGHIDRLTQDDDHRRMLLERYCRYFNITLEITEQEEVQLTSNMLFLRIFCDVNRGKTITHIERGKYRLFTAYYELMSSRTAVNLSKLTGERIFETDIEQYYDRIIALMLETKSLYGISLDKIRSKIDGRIRGVLNMFIDENILIKREVKDNSELISFTYDEFRDFLIAKYLIDSVLPTNEQVFNEIIDNVIDVNTIEGPLPFLLVHTYQIKDEQAKSIIQQKNWFEQTFALNVWNIDEDKLSNEDIDRLYSLISIYPHRVGGRLFRRWNTDIYPKINIALLLKYLSTLDYEKLKDTISRLASNTRRDYLGREVSDKHTVRANFTEFLKAVFDGRLPVKSSDSYLILKMAAFMAPFDNYIRDLVKAYLSTINKEQVISEFCAGEQSSELIDFWRRLL